MVNRVKHSGFALPSILIASVVMFAVLTVVITSIVATRMALTEQEYTRIANEAAESGISKAQQCLQLSNGEVTWSDTSPLRPETDCAGQVQVTCTNVVKPARCGVIVSSSVISSFTVGAPTYTDGKVDVVTAKATVNLLRTSNGDVWRGYAAETSRSADMLFQKEWTVDGKIVAAQSSTCAIVGGKGWCWGASPGSSTGASTRVPIPIDTSGGIGTSPITDIGGGGGGVNYGSSNATVACAIAAGKVYCWGDADGGTMGDGSAPNNSPTSGTPKVMRSIPGVVSGGGLAGKVATKVAVGRAGACAVAAGKAYCWGGVTEGGGSSGALGSALPVDFDATNALAGRTVTDVAVAGGPFGRSCVVANQELWCKSSVGAALVRVNTGSITGKTVKAVQAGPSDSICVIDTSNLAHCSVGGAAMTQLTIAGLPVTTPISDISIGGSMTTCVIAGGKAYCQGSNFAGLLGNGTNTGSAAALTEVDPGGVMGGRTLISIVVAFAHACTLDNLGVAYCWGGFTNVYGQLGNGDRTVVPGIPGPVANPNPTSTRPGFFY